MSYRLIMRVISDTINNETYTNSHAHAPSPFCFQLSLCPSLSVHLKTPLLESLNHQIGNLWQESLGGDSMKRIGERKG
jgi:hypothetical protein